MKREFLDRIEKGKIYAIVPARSGSKGVSNKNIRCLMGYPMMAYAITAGKLSENIDRVIVSTDSEYYAEIARQYGGETPFLRPAEISGDKSTDLEFMQHAINWLVENENSLPEYFVHLRPTYPMRKISVVNDAIEAIRKDASATSLRSAYKASNTPYKWFNLREDGYYKSLVDGQTLDEANNPRQAFQDVYIPDGYVDVLRTSFIIENDLLHGDRCIGFRVEDGVDVDALKDIAYLNFYLQNNTCDALEYMKKNYPKFN